MSAAVLGIFIGMIFALLRIRYSTARRINSLLIEEQRALLESQSELIRLYRENDGETVAEITKELLKPSRN